MKKFVLHVVIVIVAVVMLDNIIGTILDRKYSLTSFEPATQAFYNKYDIAMMGASDMEAHYIPRIITDSLGLSSYNFGASAQNIYTSYILLNLMLNHSNHNPQYIIYEPNYIDFYDCPEYNTKQLSKLHPMYNIDDTLQSVVNLDGWQTQTLIRLFRCYKHNSKIYDYFKKSKGKPEQNETLGFLEIEPRGYDGELEITEDAPTDKIDPQKVDYFYRFIKLCKENNIKLIVVNSPSYEMYKHVKWIKCLEEIVKEEDIPFFNYANDSYYTSHKELFHDKRHLNKYGAEDFTKKIIPVLRTIIKND